jgi:hypothetical protein
MTKMCKAFTKLLGPNSLARLRCCKDAREGKPYCWNHSYIESLTPAKLADHRVGTRAMRADSEAVMDSTEQTTTPNNTEAERGAAQPEKRRRKQQ